MFLKQGTFNYEKQSVVLSELSGCRELNIWRLFSSERQSLMPVRRTAGGWTTDCFSADGDGYQCLAGFPLTVECGSV